MEVLRVEECRITPVGPGHPHHAPAPVVDVDVVLAQLEAEALVPRYALADRRQQTCLEVAEELGAQPPARHGGHPDHDTPRPPIAARIVVPGVPSVSPFHSDPARPSERQVDTSSRHPVSSPVANRDQRPPCLPHTHTFTAPPTGPTCARHLGHARLVRVSRRGGADEALCRGAPVGPSARLHPRAVARQRLDGFCLP